MSEHFLDGPDAGALFGFLCALGALEAATAVFDDLSVGLRFRRHAMGWRPVLKVDPEVSGDELVDAVHSWVSAQGSALADLTSALGDDLPCPAEAFRESAATVEHARDRSNLLAALGVVRDGEETLQDTAFRTMSGAGHQHFLGFARQVALTTTREQVVQALFGPWTYEDLGPSLRFDPTDDRRYALRADDPASSGSRAPIRTVRAANALAFAGLRLLPVVPDGRSARTTLVDTTVRPPVVRWPLWERPVGRDQVGSIVAHAGAEPGPGVLAVFECRRLTVGKYRGFTPARRSR